MIINNEQMNSMEVYPCQLKDLYLSCYGCCRNGVISSSNIKDDLKNNFILKKCGSILHSINKSINTIVDVLKKIANKQAPKL